MQPSENDLKNLAPQQRRALLKRLMQEKQKRQEAGQPITAPVSIAQRRLWILSRLNPDSMGYNMMYAHHLDGALNEKALERAFTRLIARHETLRTTFYDERGVPFQKIHPATDHQLAVIPLQALPEAEREARAHHLITEATTQPFDLEKGPLLRTMLFKLSDHHHILAVILHHIITDNWSYKILYEALEQYYSGVAVPPQPLMQYRAYTEWEQRNTNEQELSRQLSYWCRQLASLEVTELPPDRRRPPVETYRGAVLDLALPLELHAHCRAIAQKARCTSHMFFLAAFHSLLHRHVGADDINCGVPVANRLHAEVKQAIGFFTNTLVMRTDFSGDPNFLEVLARVRTMSLEAFSNPKVPFERLVEKLQPERDMSRNPLYQIIFQEAMSIPFKLEGLAVEDKFLMDYGIVRCDLECYLLCENGRFICKVVYNKDLYKPVGVAALAQRFQCLLEDIVERPDGKVSGFNLLTETEQHQLLVSWNQVARDYPHSSVLELFQSAVDRFPHKTAVSANQNSLTYAQLSQRVDLLAGRMRQRGLKPGDLVAVCLPRDTHMVVALLAVWRAGAAYVPMDPGFPAERLAVMLEDARPAMLLTTRSIDIDLTDYPGILLHSDDPDGEADGETDGQPPPEIGPRGTAPAYIIFTSGSTGRPKGVAVSMGALVNFLTSMQETPGFTQRDTLVAVTTLSFDIAALELYLPLISGGRLVVADKDTTLDGKALATLLANTEATVLQATPATWRMLLEANWAGKSELKMLCGGEALPPDLAVELIPRGAGLWNMYGPTETTIWSAVSAVVDNRQNAEDELAVPIGHPIANTAIYVLDHHARPVPLGVPGELCIGGEGLANGYFCQAGMTAQKFIPNPFSKDGGRLYRTGDLVRFIGDDAGTPRSITFLGRFDHQVKLRGFRIELGDIESALSEHAEVAEAVVLVRPEEQQLLAYLLSHSQSDLEPNELRGFLKEKLPAYMVPAAFMTLERYPLTPNGKIDRRALGGMVPQPHHFGKEESFTHTVTPTQELVSGIWASVLGLDEVGPDSDFFLLGGHSLSATQVLTRLRDVLGVDLPMRTLFEASTVAGFAQEVDQARAQKTTSALLPPITPMPEDEDPPLSITQKRLWFLDQLQPENPTYNMPFIICMDGHLQVALLEAVINALFERHEVFRTNYTTIDESARQIIRPPAPVRLAVIEVGGYPPAEKTRVISQIAGDDALKPFNLSRDCLVRFNLLRLGAREHQLLVNVHHIISDAWSLGILVRELAILYNAFSQNKPSPLPELPIGYADFAHWQQKHLCGDYIQPQLDYWTQQLSKAPALHQLPTDKPRPTVMTNNGAHHTFWIEQEAAAALKALCREKSVTQHMALLSAYLVLLYRFSGQDDLCIGTTVANRFRPELEPMMGFFVNTLILRNDLAGDPSFNTLLERTRKTTLDAYEHQEVTIEQVVEALSPERNPAYTPLFQLLFEVQTVRLESIPLPGLELQPREEDHRTSKFDLSVSFREVDERFLCFFEYNTDLFEEGTIAKMSGKFLSILDQVLAAPDKQLTEFSILDASEQAALINDFADDFDDFY